MHVKAHAITKPFELAGGLPPKIPDNTDITLSFNINLVHYYDCIKF